jgi:hypothetical protein
MPFAQRFLFTQLVTCPPPDRPPGKEGSKVYRLAVGWLWLGFPGRETLTHLHTSSQKRISLERFGAKSGQYNGVLSVLAQRGYKYLLT